MNRLFFLIHRFRYFVLGFGLSGLHHDYWLVNLLYVVITALAIMAIADRALGNLEQD